MGLKLNQCDMIETNTFGGYVLEACMYVTFEGYVMVDITPDRPRIKGHIERYLKDTTSLPYSSRIIRAEAESMPEAQERVRKYNENHK